MGGHGDPQTLKRVQSQTPKGATQSRVRLRYASFIIPSLYNKDSQPLRLTLSRDRLKAEKTLLPLCLPGS